MRRRTVTTPALLLRAVDYGEADRVVTLLTPRFGKAAFIARGARRSKRRFGGALQPLCLLEVGVSEGSSQLSTLLQASIVRPFPRILGDLSRMSAGFGALELARELTAEHEPDDAVFASVCALLSALDAEQVTPALVSLVFQVRLLALIGFAPRLDRCGLCGKQPQPGQAAEFDPQAGHLVCRSCGGANQRIAASVRGELVRAIGPSWLALPESVPPASALLEARDAIERFIEHRIGKRLRAPALSGAARQESSS